MFVAFFERDRRCTFAIKIEDSLELSQLLLVPLALQLITFADYLLQTVVTPFG